MSSQPGMGCPVHRLENVHDRVGGAGPHIPWAPLTCSHGALMSTCAHTRQETHTWKGICRLTVSPTWRMYV